MAATLIPEPAALTQAPRNIRKTRLSNGLLVLTERVPQVRSVSMGIWLATGSRDEAPEVNGISHFVEHLVFKGTKSRSAKQLAREVDSIGGNLDAFTGKENICFNIKALDENATVALELLADLVLHPTFHPEDITREQGVILEEIKMDEDNPDYLVHEIFTQNFWKGSTLGRPILGTKKTVPTFTQDVVFAEYNRRFTSSNMVFSAAGNIDHDSFLAEVDRYFGALPTAWPGSLHAEAAPKPRPHITLRRKRSLEQVQICLGVVAPQLNDSRRYALYMLNTILGGGMSSRLFQTVREDRGLAYSIYSELNLMRDTGVLNIFAGAAVEKTREVVELTLADLHRLKQETVSTGELKRAKDQLKSNIVLGLESSGSRMANLARQQMYFGRFFGIDEIVADIDRIDPAAVQQLANELFEPERIALAMLGDLGEMAVERADLVC